MLMALFLFFFPFIFMTFSTWLYYKWFRNDAKAKITDELFHDDGPYHIETSLLIYRANRDTIETSSWKS